MVVWRRRRRAASSSGGRESYRITSSALASVEASSLLLLLLGAGNGERFGSVVNQTTLCVFLLDCEDVLSLVATLV